MIYGIVFWLELKSEMVQLLLVLQIVFIISGFNTSITFSQLNYVEFCEILSHSL